MRIIARTGFEPTVAARPADTAMIYSPGISEPAHEMRRQTSVLSARGHWVHIGAAVRFLLDNQARYIASHVLVVDGGATLVGPSRASQ